MMRAELFEPSLMFEYKAQCSQDLVDLDRLNRLVRDKRSSLLCNDNFKKL